MFFALFVFVSNSVAQEASSSSDAYFLLAVQNGELEYVAELLESGLVDINATNELGRNALMLADSHSHRVDEMLELLIEKGIDVKAEDKNGRTALSYHIPPHLLPPPHPSAQIQIILLRAGAQWSEADRRFNVVWKMLHSLGPHELKSFNSMHYSRPSRLNLPESGKE